MAIAAAQLGMIDSAAAQVRCPPIKPGTNTSFGAIKQIDAGVLNVGYAEAGPANGVPVILLHGWPYDIHTYVDVAPLLASAGYRVIVPYLRGYGTTRFLSSETPRNGQQSAIAVDIIALRDALSIEKAILGGCDWGARTVNIMAALWPERVQVHGLREWLSDRQPGSGQDAAAAERRTPMVVSILLCDGTRPRGLRQIPARVFQTDLADRFAEVGFRRRDLRAQRGRFRQPRSCRHHD